MENILKRNSEGMKQYILSYLIIVAMLFGILNPVAYLTERNTAKEISGMGKAVNFEVAALPFENVCPKQIVRGNQIVLMEKNMIARMDVTDGFENMHRIRTVADIVDSSNETIADSRPTVAGSRSSITVPAAVVEDSNAIISNSDETVTIPDMDNESEEVPGVIVNPISEGEKVAEQPTYIEIHGMKVDSEGYITEITGEVSDGLIVFPTDSRCIGIRADVFKQSDASVVKNVDEIWIPANITKIEEGAFDSFQNVDFIEVADGNPAYYSEAGILYNADGSIACVPPSRIR